MIMNENFKISCRNCCKQMTCELFNTVQSCLHYIKWSETKNYGMPQIIKEENQNES